MQFEKPYLPIKLKEYLDKLEQIYENLDNVTEKALNKKLTEGKDIAFLSKELATIQKNLDIPYDFESAKLEMPDYDAVIDFFKKKQFYNFLKNIDKILKPFKIESLNSQPAQAPITDGGQMQLGLGIGTAIMSASHKEYNHKKTIVDTEEALKELVEELKKQTIFSIDVETTGINPLECDLVGISIAYCDQIQTKNSRVKIYPDADVEISGLGVVIGAHCGPGLFTVFYMTDARRA